MTQPQQTQCANFQAQIGGFPKADDVDRVFGKYIGDPLAVKKEMDDLLVKYQNQREGFQRLYQEQVRILMEKCWRSGIKDPEDYTIDKDGRILIKDNFIVPFNLLYFPGLIKQVKGSFSYRGVQIKSFDYLEEIGGYFDCLHSGSGCIPLSIKRLKRIGGWFSVDSRKINVAHSLEETGEFQCVNSITLGFPNLTKVRGKFSIAGSKNIRSNFRAFFPKLEEVGLPSFTPENQTITVPTQILKDEVDQLIDQGTLLCYGGVVVG